MLPGESTASSSSFTGSVGGDNALVWEGVPYHGGFTLEFFSSSPLVTEVACIGIASLPVSRSSFG